MPYRSEQPVLGNEPATGVCYCRHSRVVITYYFHTALRQIYLRNACKRTLVTPRSRKAVPEKWLFFRCHRPGLNHRRFLAWRCCYPDKAEDREEHECIPQAADEPVYCVISALPIMKENNIITTLSKDLPTRHGPVHTGRNTVKVSTEPDRIVFGEENSSGLHPAPPGKSTTGD